jgi:hypothetical protein
MVLPLLFHLKTMTSKTFRLQRLPHGDVLEKQCISPYIVGDGQCKISWEV